MNKAFRMRLSQKVFSLAMLFCVFVGVAMLMWFIVLNWLQYNRFIGKAAFSDMCGDFVNEIITAYGQGGFKLFAPIFAVLPCATVFCDDYNSGYIKAILLRTSKRKYILECIACCSISGGLAVLLPYLICSCVFLIAGKPHIPTEYGSYFELLSKIEYIWEGRFLVLVFLIFSFLFGVVWANIGLCISAYVPNRYIAMAAPFALYYGIHLVLQRTEVLSVLSPVNMLLPTSPVLPNLLFPVCYQLLLAGGSILLFYRCVSRRLKNV